MPCTIAPTILDSSGAEGFVPLDALGMLVQMRFDPSITGDDIAALVESSQPRRYEHCGELIRATYGHSRVIVEYPAATPPTVLFHGTHPAAIASSFRIGSRAMKRRYVHLSRMKERALEVASRRTSEPVILVVHALDAHAASVLLHSPEPQHFLTREIPPQFSEFPEK